MNSSEHPMPEPDKLVWSREFEPEDGKPSERNLVTQQELYEALASLKPIRIRGAILPQGVSFRHGQIARELRIEDCEVRGPFILENVSCGESIVLTGTVFKGGLKLNGSQIKGELQTDRIRCEKLALNDGSVIRGKAELKRTSVEAQWSCNGAVFSDGFDIEYGVFRGPVSFQSCSFEGDEAIFGLATFHQSADFWQTRFLTEGASFVSASFRSHLLFNEVRSSGKLTFSLCRVDGTINAERCRFLQDVVFHKAVVLGFWNLDHAVCHGLLDCWSLAAEQVAIDHCRFARGLVFRNASLQSLSILHSSFARNAACNLESVETKGELKIHGCRFGANLTLYGANVGSLSIGGGGKIDPFKDDFASLQCADVFLYRDLTVSDARVRGRFTCYRVLFLGQSSFQQMRIEGPADVVRCRFGMNERMASNAPLSGLKPWKMNRLLSHQRELFKEGEEEVAFDRSAFRGRLGIQAIFSRPVRFHGIQCHGGTRFISGCVFEYPAEFYFATFFEEANFGGAEFKSHLNLRNARCLRGLRFDLLRPPTRTRFAAQSRIDMRECTYESLQKLPQWEPGLYEETQSGNSDLTCFLNHLEEGRSAFIFLEQYYRRTGETDDADRVRRYWRGREGDKKRHIAWLWDQLLRRTTGYGTKFAPLIIALAAIGCFDLSIQILYAFMSFKNPGISTQLITVVARTVHLVSTALLATGAAVLGDTFRRSLWPEKS
jgi:hypothetical protein